MFRFVKFALATSKPVLNEVFLFNIINCFFKKFKCVLSFSRTTCYAKDFYSIIFCSPFKQCKMCLYHTWINVMFLCPEVFIESKLVSDHWICFFTGIPAPRASFPINDMDFIVRSLNNQVDETFKLIFIFTREVLNMFINL